MTWLHLVYAYILGGVTLIPAAILGFIFLHPKKPEIERAPPLMAAKIEEATDTGLTTFKQGWIVVTHEELESQDDISGKSGAVGDLPDSKSAYSSLYKLVTNTRVAARPESERSDKGERASGQKRDFKDDAFTLPEETSDEPDPSPIPSATPTPASAPSKKHRYYAVLKHGNLFLYKNERMQDVKHVIVLQNHMVTLWPRNLTEASIFTKYSSIALLKADWCRPRRLSENREEWQSDKVTTQDVIDQTSNLPAPPGAIFIYTDYNIDKEDWYFSLIRATKSASYVSPALDPGVHAETLHFPTAHSMKLIQALYSSEGQLQTKWINSILGRLFLSLQQTDIMRDYLVLKIEKKLNKIKTPGFLDKFSITRVDAGSSAPLISYPVLREMNPEGNLLVSFDVHYTGGLSMQLATKVNINLGSRFKTREVDVVLSITFEKVCGPMLLRMKPPPSTRLWYTFETEPQMAIKIEPVISSRSMSYGVITNSIEKKFKDAIRDSLVLPHWDDIVFYHAHGLYRGGLWESPKKEQGENEQKSNGEQMSEQKSNGEKEKENEEDQEPNAPTGAQKTDTDDATSLFTDDASFSSATSSATPTRSKVRLTSTLNDLSRRLRKPKSASTLGVDDTGILSDGSEVRPEAMSSEERTYGLHKIGNWYKPEKTPASPGSAYVPPEMITSRRPRKQSSATLNSDERAEKPEVPGYDFGARLLSDDRISNTIDVQSEPDRLHRKPPPDEPL